jgi:hypothetical protein
MQRREFITLLGVRGGSMTADRSGQFTYRT